MGGRAYAEGSNQSKKLLRCVLLEVFMQMIGGREILPPFLASVLLSLHSPAHRLVFGLKASS